MRQPDLFTFAARQEHDALRSMLSDAYRRCQTKRIHDIEARLRQVTTAMLRFEIGEKN